MNWPFTKQTILVFRVNIIAAAFWRSAGFNPDMRSDCTARLFHHMMCRTSQPASQPGRGRCAPKREQLLPLFLLSQITVVLQTSASIKSTPTILLSALRSQLLHTAAVSGLFLAFGLGFYLWRFIISKQWRLSLLLGNEFEALRACQSVPFFLLDHRCIFNYVERRLIDHMPSYGKV